MYVTQNASRLRIPDHFPLPSLRVADFKRFISVSQRYFSHSHRSIFTTLGEMTVADNVMNPQDLESQRRRAIEALEARAPQYCDCGPDWPLLFKVHEI